MKIPVVIAVVQGLKNLVRQLAQSVVIQGHTGDFVLSPYKFQAFQGVPVKIRGDIQIVLQKDDAVVALGQAAALQNVPLEAQVFLLIDHLFFPEGPGKVLGVA